MEAWLVLGAAMLAAGCLAGILAGLFGIGGGIVVVPVLEAILSALGVDTAIRMHIAVATSLAVIVPTSIASARAHARKDAVDISLVKRWATFVVLGAFAGAWIAAQFHSRVLAAVFAVLALFVALKLLLFPQHRNLADSIPEGGAVFSIPALIGGLSAMMGIGGGTFSVMVLTMFNQPIHRAVGTAALIGLFIAIPGVIGFVVLGWADPRLPTGNIGYVSLIGLLCIAPMTVLCAPLGARIAHAFAARTLSMLFGAFLIVAAARMLYKATL